MVLKKVALLLALEFALVRQLRKEVQLAEAKVVQREGVFLTARMNYAFVFQSQVLRWPVMVLRR